MIMNHKEPAKLILEGAAKLIGQGFCKKTYARDTNGVDVDTNDDVGTTSTQVLAWLEQAKTSLEKDLT